MIGGEEDEPFLDAGLPRLAVPAVCARGSGRRRGPGDASAIGDDDVEDHATGLAAGLEKLRRVRKLLRRLRDNVATKLDAAAASGTAARKEMATRFESKKKEMATRLETLRDAVRNKVGAGGAEMMGGADGDEGGSSSPRRRLVPQQARRLYESALETQQRSLKEAKREVRKTLAAVKGRLRRRGWHRGLRHKACFTACFVDCLLTSYFLGKNPELHYMLHTARIVVLGLCRFILYRMTLDHYFMLGFCYFSNLVLLLYIYVWPQEPFMFHTVNGFSGLLLLSIPVFRNSVVLHKLDAMTTTYLHVSPVLTIWSIRWYANADVPAADNPRGCGGMPNSNFATAGGMDVVQWWPAIAMYLLWKLLYVLKINVLSREKIEKRNYMTLFKYMAFDMGIKDQLPAVLQPHAELVFLAGHAVLFFAGLPFMCLGFYAQTLLILAGVVWAVANGARFYIDYYWRIYDKNLALYSEAAETVLRGSDAGGGRRVGSVGSNGDEHGGSESPGPLSAEEEEPLSAEEEPVSAEDDDDDDDDGDGQRRYKEEGEEQQHRQQQQQHYRQLQQDGGSDVADSDGGDGLDRAKLRRHL